MLSDLYLTGHLEDKENDEGTRCPVGLTSPDVQCCVRYSTRSATSRARAGRKWSPATHNQKPPKSSAASLRPPDGCRCGRAAGWASFPPLVLCCAMKNWSAVWPPASPPRCAGASPASLPTSDRARSACSGALGGLPTVVSEKEVSRHYHELDNLTFRGIPPVKGMREAIYKVREEIDVRIESTRWGP